ncbi:hypothetical protein M1E17_07495 [Arthrobacter sp. D1-29]
MSIPREPYQPDAGSAAGQAAPASPAAPVAPASPQTQPAPPEHQPGGGYPATAQSGIAGHDSNPFGLPGQQPPVKSRRKLWIILGSAGGVLLLVIIGLIILVNVVGSATNQARGLADDFTKLVISGDTDQAYGYLDPALHDQLTKESFIEGIATLELNDSCKPSYNDVQVTSENGTNSADIAGLITCDNDKKIDLAYRFEGQDELKMINIKLRPQE